MTSALHGDAEGVTTWQKPESRFELRVISPTLTLDRVVGVIDDETAQAIAANHDAVFALGNRPHTFHDWTEVVGYSPSARKFLTDWLHASRGRLSSVHILFSSRLLAMGISLANLVLGGFIQAYGDRERFGNAMRKAARED